MSYLVTASDRDRPVLYRRGSMMAALEQALALLGCGMDQVIVTDLEGRRRSPAEFARFAMGRDAPADRSPEQRRRA